MLDLCFLDYYYIQIWVVDRPITLRLSDFIDFKLLKLANRMSGSSQDYELLEQVQADGDIPITLYRNKITGLRVATGFVECPIVSGNILVPTEAFDDDGLPHTLEHLIFMGSQDYPYKGVLDLVANKCLADGTNAWTDTDHTNYTVSTAGADGFLQLLPIYLDHVLFPTLTESAYITEVHHINGEGENAGVVYCEMQARENSGESRCYLEMMRDLYPGKCGYKSETGGLVENLRTSTNNTKVRNYHKEFYHSKNVCIIVTGPVQAQDIFKVIKPIEDKIVASGQHSLPFERPWQSPVEPLPESVVRRLQYSCDSDDDGLVYIGFRGPSAVNDMEELLALNVLSDYLDMTAISPLQRDFVECDEPYCSSVSHSVIENSISCFYFSFESVGKQYLDDVCNKFLNLLKKIHSGEEALDMERLRTILSRNIVRSLSCAEQSPHKLVTSSLIGHILYGKDGNLSVRVQDIPMYEKFSTYDARYWLDLLHKYLVGPDSRYVCIVGEPSPKVAKKMAEEEKQRIAKQREDMKDQIPALADKLRLAIEQNSIPPPSELLNIASIPSTDRIIFHPLERIVLDESKTPFRIHYDSIKTNFITIVVGFDTSHGLTKQDRFFLPLLSEILFESPIERNGELIPYEKIVSELFSDTISYAAGIGLSSGSSYSVGACSMLFSLAMQVELSKYDKAVQWCHELIYKTVFSPERVKTVITRMISDISQCKRSGGKVCSALTNALTYQSNSNQWATNFMRLQKFLKSLLKSLKEEPEIVQKNFNRIRDHLARPNNFFVHLALNKEKVDIQQLHKPWLNIIPNHLLDPKTPHSHIQLNNIIPCCKLVESPSSPKAAVIGVSSVESNYLQQFTRCIDDPTHPDLPALRVFINYLTQLEGPLYRQVRGTGLSYHYDIQASVGDGLMYFTLYKSTQLVQAYATVAKIINSHMDGSEEIQDDLLESAKSTSIFEIIRREKSAADKSLQSLLCYVKNLNINYNRDFIKKVAAVTKEDLRRVGPMIKKLFEDPERRTAVCCHPNNIDQICKGLETYGNHLSKVNLEEEPSLNAIN